MVQDVEKSKTLTSVETTFEIVEVLNDLVEAGVSEIADKAGLPASTTHVHLSTLCNLGYVQKSNHQYRLSFRFLEHGGAVRQQLKNFQIIQEEVNQIANLTGEISGFAVEEQGQRVLLYRSVGRGGLSEQVPVGQFTNMHWTSLGKAILAHLPENRVTEIIDEYGLPRATESTITSRSHLLTELDRICDKGYAIETGEYLRGINGVAVPILYSDDTVFGAVGISGPEVRLQENYLEQAIEVLLHKKNIIEIRYNHFG